MVAPVSSLGTHDHGDQPAAFFRVGCREALAGVGRRARFKSVDSLEAAEFSIELIGGAVDFAFILGLMLRGGV